jgi:signal transduction histidine kinase
VIAVWFALLDTAATLGGATWWPTRPGPLAWAMLALQAVACLALAARRRAPFAGVAMLGAFTLAVTLLVSPVGALTPAHSANVYAPFATMVAAYGPLFCGRDRRRAALLWVGVLAVIAARPWQPSPTVVTIGLLRTAVGPLLAVYLDTRRRLVMALTERAERAERERHLLADQARAEERARLAGEMHDVVSHRISLMVLAAGALRLTAPDEPTRRAAEELRSLGSQALDELRDLVGILRTAPEPDQAPSASDIRVLIAESTAVGVPTELIEEGDPELASPAVGRTAYRIVREALTNVRKHAPGASVTVRVEYGDRQVQLLIRNTKPTGRPAAMAGTGSGLGIANLRQRIDLVHGTLKAGQTEDGGFRLLATLPAYVPTVQPGDERPNAALGSVIGFDLESAA